ncbi:50S ribosomal protein L10 [Candidatus Woesearchaeota archaeon]|nr:MAG: 50S ribosomal protein L10 [Candidatus Woesearchaeota archaeon]
MPEKTCKAAESKKQVVAKIIKLAKENPIIGIINMENLPAGNLQKIKAKLRGQIELVMTRKTLIKLALKELKLKNGDKLIESLKGMPALLFTKENPFKIYKIIKQNKSPAPAKPGQIAPYDITIPAGPTPFGPGPIISEFAQLGIKAGVEGGKVAIKEDTVVVKEGEPIKEKLAGMLQKLGIEPMEIGLNLTLVYEKGTIYPKKVLDIDEKQFMQDIITAASKARNLALEIGLATKDTIEELLIKANRQAKQLAKEGNILTKENIGEILGKAQAQAQEIQKQISK